MSMNFEVVFEKYRNGTATEEEKAYVEAEIAKARRLNEVINEMEAGRAVKPAAAPDVKKAMNKAKKKNAIRIAVISFVVVFAVALAAVGSLLIYVNTTAAGKAAYTKTECIEAAKASVLERLDDTSKEMVVTDVEKDLRYEQYGKLSSAVYMYEIEIRVGYWEYEVLVDSATGQATVTDIGD